MDLAVKKRPGSLKVAGQERIVEKSRGENDEARDDTYGTIGCAE